MPRCVSVPLLPSAGQQHVPQQASGQKYYKVCFLEVAGPWLLLLASSSALTSNVSALQMENVDAERASDPPQRPKREKGKSRLNSN